MVFGEPIPDAGHLANGGKVRAIWTAPTPGAGICVGHKSPIIIRVFTPTSELEPTQMPDRFFGGRPGELSFIDCVHLEWHAAYAQRSGCSPSHYLQVSDHDLRI